MARLFSLSECTASVRIYSRGTCFKTTGDYDNLDTCTIKVLEACQLEVHSFLTESDHDILSVNGVFYSGAVGPDGVDISHRDEITFTADYSITNHGFDICGLASSSVVDSSNSELHRFMDFASENLCFVIIVATSLGFFVLYLCRRISNRHQATIQKDLDWEEQMWPRMVCGEIGKAADKSFSPRHKVVFMPRQSIEGDEETVEPGSVMKDNGTLAILRRSVSVLSDVRPKYSVTISDSVYVMPKLDFVTNVVDILTPASVNDDTDDESLIFPGPPPDLAPLGSEGDLQKYQRAWVAENEMSSTEEGKRVD